MQLLVTEKEGRIRKKEDLNHNPQVIPAPTPFNYYHNISSHSTTVVTKSIS